jgi:hypothetical protein
MALSIISTPPSGRLSCSHGDSRGLSTLADIFAVDDDPLQHTNTITRASEEEVGDPENAAIEQR